MQGFTEEVPALGVLLVDIDMLVRLHDHLHGIAQHRGHEGEVFGVFEGFGRPGGPDHVGVPAPAGFEGNGL